MADATPSRPIPQRHIKEGKVALPEGAEVFKDEDEEIAEQDDLSDVAAEPVPPKPLRIPKVGTFNERGAEVLKVRRMPKSGAIHVDYK